MLRLHRMQLCGIAALTACLLALGASFAAEIDTSPLSMRAVPALPDITWTGWDFGDDSGVLRAIRPILLTNAGDRSGRLFIPTQQGVIHVLPKGTKTKETAIFLDINEKVAYDDKTNEEGFLGLAFHPKYAENGQFFVFYTNKAKKRQNVIARYRVSKDDPNRADPASEEILMTIDKPFWNHDGGTIVFGPDGYLYVALGDGGLAADPYRNGQKLSTLLGKILRIDVDHAGEKTPYSIPKDNPFVNKGDARGEIWAYGLRNVWRMAFDRTTGTLWAGDVGQDIWEEVDLITKGGNFGWNTREGLHAFVKKDAKPPANAAKPADMIDPIWEYHHDVGKSITGGLVYRGKLMPDLVGAYLYADYVSGKLWALYYDEAKKQVTANREIPLPKSLPIMSFGEDEEGEVYFTIYAFDKDAVFRIEK